MVKRLHFTLLELMLVIGILSLVAGFVSINVVKMLRDQHFRTEVSQVLDTVRTAQDLMLIYDTNVKVVFTQKSGNDPIEYEIQFDTPIPVQWAKQLKPPRRTMKHIKKVNFYDEKQVCKKVENERHVGFFSGGSVMSRGLIILSTHDNYNAEHAITRYIALSGHPQPLSISAEEPKGYMTESSTYVTPLEDQMDVRLTQIIKEEIRAKAEEKKS